MSAICRHCCEPIGDASWLVRAQQNMRVDDAYHERCWAAANGLPPAPPADVRNATRQRLWGPKRIAEAFAKVALPDGTVGEEEIMYVLQGIIEEYEANEAQAAMPPAAYNQLRIALAEKEEADGRASTVHARAWLRQHKPVVEQVAAD